MANISRIDKLKGLNLSLANANDNQIIDIYNLFIKNIICKKEVSTRCLMVGYILSNMQIASDNTLDKIYEYVDQNGLLVDTGTLCINLDNDSRQKFTETSKSIKKKKKVQQKDRYIENEKENEDITNEKYQMILKFVKGLLENSGKDHIERLTKFKDVDKIDIVTNENTEYLETMSDELFKLFDKRECRYYPKKSKSWVLNVLRGIVKSIGYDLIAKRTEVYKNKYRRIAMVYEIKK